MNFLLHRYLAETDLGSPIAGCGAMLPDLWRMADRRVRAQRLTPVSFAAAPLAELLAGIRHHLETDRWFHDHPVFTDGQRLTAERFRSAGLTTGKMLLLAHAAWELCLDGALVRRQGLAAVLSPLAAGFRGAAGEMARAADLHHFDLHLRSSAERAAFDRRMRHLWQQLIWGDWISGYRHGEGLAARLLGLRRRLGLGDLEERQAELLGECFDDLLEVAVKRLPLLIEPLPRRR